VIVLFSVNVQFAGVMAAVGIGNTASLIGSIASSGGQAIVRAGVMDAVGVGNTASLIGSIASSGGQGTLHVH
jgi:hypothetical protein